MSAAMLDMLADDDTDRVVHKPVMAADLFASPPSPQVRHTAFRGPFAVFRCLSRSFHRLSLPFTAVLLPFTVFRCLQTPAGVPQMDDLFTEPEPAASESAETAAETPAEAAALSPDSARDRARSDAASGGGKRPAIRHESCDFLDSFDRFLAIHRTSWVFFREHSGGVGKSAGEGAGAFGQPGRADGRAARPGAGARAAQSRARCRSRDGAGADGCCRAHLGRCRARRG